MISEALSCSGFPFYFVRLRWFLCINSLEIHARCSQNPQKSSSLLLTFTFCWSKTLFQTPKRLSQKYSKSLTHTHKIKICKYKNLVLPGLQVKNPSTDAPVQNKQKKSFSSPGQHAFQNQLHSLYTIQNPFDMKTKKKMFCNELPGRSRLGDTFVYINSNYMAGIFIIIII